MNVSIVPDRMESYYSPQLFRRSSNEEYILLGTGGETHGGGLYAFDLKCFTNECSNPVKSSIRKEKKMNIELNFFLVYNDHRRSI